MFWSIIMFIVAAAATFGGVRQSRIAQGLGNKRMATVWMIVAIFCGLIALLELAGLIF